MTVRIINADVMDGLRQLPDESVQCVVTSPPYWGLRDYGVAGQIGLEATPAEFVARMVEVFREVRRVLRPDGVCFVNLGDSYNAAGRVGHGSRDGFKQATNRASASGADECRPSCSTLKPKDLIGIPWRVAFALQDDGWYLRGDYIWAKPNAMPESVTDRCTKSHEYVFHFAKSERYFWDQEAIKESAIWGMPNSPESIASPYGQGFTRRAKDHPVPAGKQHKQHSIGQQIGGKLGSNDDWGVRNKRSVWTVATTPFPEAHFATFPTELPTICIKAGSRPGDTVLDPFSGAGTTALVADRLQRQAIGIELNPEYAEMSRNRIDRDRGGLLDVMEATQ